MPLRPPAGFRSAFYDPLKVADAPTIGTGTAGDAQASVTFTAPSNVGGSAITQYYAVSDPNQITGNAASSPITVTGLTNGTAYTFRVWALNSYGPSPYSAATGSVTPAATRGIFGGGDSGSTKNIMDYISISTTGNAVDFGDLIAGATDLASCSSSTRGIFGGGSGSGGRQNVIQYITISSTGNSIDFGDLTGPFSGQSAGLSGCSNSTRGVFGGGYDGTDYINNLQYITIASLGNSIDFGDLTQGTMSSGSFASTTRGVWGASTTNAWNVISYITIATTGNAIDFGDLLTTSNSAPTSGCSNTTRGLFVGANNSNVIQYITIATTGNAVDFGDMLYNPGPFGSAGACASSTIATFGGGYVSNFLNNINYVTIATTGNAIDFGDLTVARYGGAACSNGHGGLS